MANVNQQAYNDWITALNSNGNRNFNMFNPTDAYMSFTSQVANTPNWWESLARLATAPLFNSGIRFYQKMTREPKPTGGKVNTDAVKKAAYADFEKMIGLPQFAAKAGVNYTDPYGNTFTPTEIQQPWTVDVNEMLNPDSKWKNPLLASLENSRKHPFGLDYSTQPTNNQNTFNAQDYINLNPYPKKIWWNNF